MVLAKLNIHPTFLLYTHTKMDPQNWNNFVQPWWAVHVISTAFEATKNGILAKSHRNQ
jgi:hypothetical protein